FPGALVAKTGTDHFTFRSEIFYFTKSQKVITDIMAFQFWKAMGSYHTYNSL
ncbi:hypothetical protein L9F63_015496, partial [Diploptera punctata]